jgi:light-regulated signal transduction histidine kinase (bacteriophytochrome)
MGRASMKFVRVDLNALVADLKRKLVIEGDTRPIEWRIGALPKIKGDPTMLRLAIQNLFDNALKFSRMRNPAIIEVGATETDDEQIIHVRDNGSGFDQAYVGKLFGVFQRLHRVEEFEGTGIGLANVKRIVERHGGRVWAEGRLDEGATMFMAFPIKAGKDHG